MPAEKAGLVPGDTVAGWVIERLLGRGGMGAVYLARHPRLPRHDAIKVLPPELAHDERFLGRFRTEGDMLGRLSHPHIVSIYDRGEQDELLYLVMQYVPGGDVRALLERDGRLPLDRALTIIRQVASALDSGHQQRMVHRDVKPDNILLANRDGADFDHAMLADFGLTYLLDAATRFSRTGEMSATVAYAAPEQIEGRKVDGRADQYALAGTFYELLAGWPPLARDGLVATMHAQLTVAPPALPSELGLAPLDVIVQRALAKDPDERFPSCGEFVSAVEAAAAKLTAPPSRPEDRDDRIAVHRAGPDRVGGTGGEGTGSPDRKPIGSNRSGDRARNRKRLVAVVGLVVVIAAILGVVGVVKRSAGKPAGPASFTVARMSGDVLATRGPSGVAGPVSLGERFPVGTRIETRAGSSVDLDAGKGASVRLDSGSAVRLGSTGSEASGTGLVIEVGHVWTNLPTMEYPIMLAGARLIGTKGSTLLTTCAPGRCDVLVVRGSVTAQAPGLSAPPLVAGHQYTVTDQGVTVEGDPDPIGDPFAVRSYTADFGPPASRVAIEQDLSGHYSTDFRHTRTTFPNGRLKDEHDPDLNIVARCGAASCTNAVSSRLFLAGSTVKAASGGGFDVRNKYTYTQSCVDQFEKAIPHTEYTRAVDVQGFLRVDIRSEGSPFQVRRPLEMTGTVRVTWTDPPGACGGSLRWSDDYELKFSAA